MVQNVSWVFAGHNHLSSLLFFARTTPACTGMSSGVYYCTSEDVLNLAKHMVRSIACEWQSCPGPSVLNSWKTFEQVRFFPFNHSQTTRLFEMYLNPSDYTYRNLLCVHHKWGYHVGWKQSCHAMFTIVHACNLYECQRDFIQVLDYLLHLNKILIEEELIS